MLTIYQLANIPQPGQPLPKATPITLKTRIKGVTNKQQLSKMEEALIEALPEEFHGYIAYTSTSTICTEYAKKEGKLLRGLVRGYM